MSRVTMSRGQNVSKRDERIEGPGAKRTCEGMGVTAGEMYAALASGDGLGRLRGGRLQDAIASLRSTATMLAESSSSSKSH